MSERENLKLLSIRVEPIVLKLLDEQVQLHTYWKRNTIINLLLKTILTRFTDRQLYDMMRCAIYRDAETDIKFDVISHSNE